MTLLQARQIERTYFSKEIYGPCIVVGNHTILPDGLLLLHAVSEPNGSCMHSFWGGKSNFLW